MNNNRRKLIENFNKVKKIILQQVDDVIHELSNDEMDRIAKGRINVKLSIKCSENRKSEVTANQSKSKKQNHNDDLNINIEEVKLKLQQLSDKDEGIKYLQKVCPSNNFIENLAKDLEVHLTDKKKDKMIEAIVNATIGSRSRSQAIQGNLSLSNESGNDVKEELNNSEIQTSLNNLTSEHKKTDDINGNKQEQN